MLTEKTITDDQIRDLICTTPEDRRDRAIALGYYWPPEDRITATRVSQARARCAELVNAAATISGRRHCLNAATGCVTFGFGGSKVCQCGCDACWIPAGKGSATKTPEPKKLGVGAALGQLGSHWYRLARDSNGLLVLETASDFTIQTTLIKGPNYHATWAWVADVPDTMAARLTDDDDADQVASVLASAISAMIEGAH